MIKILDTLDKGGNVINLTGAASDYDLKVGETAFIAYSSATSVPLRVSTVEGLYELEIIGEEDASISTTAWTTLSPNGTTVTAGAIDFAQLYKAMTTNAVDSTAPGGEKDGNNLTTFRVAYMLNARAHVKISTFIKSKNLITTCISRESATGFFVTYHAGNWLDTTTVWSSLGTLTFPFAQSGKIIVRRII